MGSDFDRTRRRPGTVPPGSRARPGARPAADRERDRDFFDEGEEWEEDTVPQRGSRPAARPRGRPAPNIIPARQRQAPRGLFGSRRPPSRRGRPAGGFDWGEVDEEDQGEAERFEDDGGWEAEQDLDGAPLRARGPSRRPRRGARATLMDLCTPVFGYAAILPRDAGGIHPGYQQFRQEVMGALQRIESEAPEHGLDREDAREAVYALAMFMDEQVAESEWSGRPQWAGEPLHIVLLNDPEGGVNFFARLERLGDRQRAVKKVFLVCLALGFRGKFAELDPAQQAARIGEIRQKLLRSIQGPLDRQEILFPEAYEPAVPLEGQAPPPPKWWVVASLGTVAVAVILWLAFFWVAGRLPEPTEERLRSLAGGGRPPAESPAEGAESAAGEETGP